MLGMMLEGIQPNKEQEFREDLLRITTISFNLDF